VKRKYTMKMNKGDTLWEEEREDRQNARNE
jgi:hypothetical protein